MTETIVSRDGTHLICERVGSGPPVVLLGGAFSTRQSGQVFARTLAGRFSVLCVDRRGHGETIEGGPYAVEREIEDVAALIAALGGTASIYGHSSGAALALRAAAAGLPVAKLAVYEPPYAADQAADAHQQETVVDLRRRLAAGDNEGAAARFLASVGTPEPMIAGIRQSPGWPIMVKMGPSLPNEFALLGTDASRRVPADVLGAIAVPTLVLAGGASPPSLVEPARQVAAAIPGATFRLLPEQTHGVSPDVLAPILIEFFA